MNEKIHVLLIEDNAIDARLVKGMLEHDQSRSFVLKHASTLEQGVRFLERGSEYQVILLDLGLPGVSGLQALRRVIPLAENASVVVITALQDEELGIVALREGAHDYVIKGHTHIFENYLTGKTRVINPGSLYGADEFSVAILHTESGRVERIRIEAD